MSDVSVSPALPDLEGHSFARPTVTAFFHHGSNTLTYVVADPATRDAVVIDPARDYDQASGQLGTAAADEVLAFIAQEDLKISHILETHVHADHLSAAPYLKEALGCPIGIGARVTEVQKVFGEMFAAGPDFAMDGSQFDHLFVDGQRFEVGQLSAYVISTPGHTPACVSYLIGDALFCGDTVFMPDFGTARCDFPGGDARVLYQSVHRLFDLPSETRLFVGHDYLCGERTEHRWETSIGEQREANIHLRDGISEDEFVDMRAGRDRQLSMPALMLPAVQVNMRAGHLPPAEENGQRYLKIPVTE